jgi:Protein of unknown function (DUF3515)
MNAGAALRRADGTAPLVSVVSVLLGLLLLGGCSAGAVHIDASRPSAAAQGPCRRLLGSLPAQVADQSARKVEPTDAWGAAWGDPPIVLTCGGAAPRGFGRASTCTTVNGVDWYLPEDQLEPGGAPSDVTMTTVHRAAYVQVRLPAEYWPPATALADLSAAVKAAVPPTGHCV